MKIDKFNKGDLVWCYYHFTPKFSPPMCGRVISQFRKRKKHHFSLEKDGKCYWYLVCMENGLSVKMPSSCMKDLKAEIDNHNNHNHCPWDVEQIDAWLTLNKWQADRVKYWLSS